MTDKRLERNRENSKKLNNIILWSLENREDWLSLCCGDTENGIPMRNITDLIDQCLFHGYMELYYMLLTIVAEAVGVTTHSEKFIQFLEASINEGLTLNTQEIKVALKDLRHD